MCGRFTISKKADEVAERFNVDVEYDKYQAVYNAAPGQFLPVIGNNQPGNLCFYHWGLVPFWAKDSSIGYKMINARAESINKKPAFRQLIKSKRCLIPSDGFYEWQKQGRDNVPYRLCMQDGELFAFGGIWEIWKKNETDVLHSFSIITTAPNELTGIIHDRMPLILDAENEKLWLDINTDHKLINELLRPYPASKMKAYQVTSMVGNVHNNFPELLIELKN